MADRELAICPRSRPTLMITPSSAYCQMTLIDAALSAGHGLENAASFEWRPQAAPISNASITFDIKPAFLHWSHLM